MYKAIIFDFGNTLAESSSLTQTLEHVVDVKDAQIIGAEIEKEIGALYRPEQREQPSWLNIWERGFQAAGLDFEERIGRKHLEEFCSQNDMFPGVYELLERLRSLRIKTGLLSNVTGPPEIFQHDLESRQLSQLFDVVVWSSSIGYRKPFHLAFEIVLSRLGASPVEALMVGDSEIADIGGAHAVGMDAALVTKKPVGNTKAKYQVDRQKLFNDVLAIIEAKNEC